jgi:IS1 family transposase
MESHSVALPGPSALLLLGVVLPERGDLALGVLQHRTSSWTNCAPGCAAISRCCGCGWPSIPLRSFFPCSISVPARRTWRIELSTPCGSSWPPFCLPLFTSDGLNVYFYAPTAHFGQWLEVARRGRKVRQWQVVAGLIYGQVKKSYQRRMLVRVTHMMRLGTSAALKVALQELGLSGRLNTAFIERVNLTVRQGVAALARRTWATAKPAPQLLAHLEWWRAYFHFVRPHASLRVALVQPRERGGELLAQRYRQRTPAMAAGRTNRRWAARVVLCYPLPAVPHFTR